MQKCYNIMVTGKVLDVGFRSLIEDIAGIVVLKDIKGDTSALPDIKSGVENINSGIEKLNTKFDAYIAEQREYNKEQREHNKEQREYNKEHREHNRRLEKILEKLAGK